MVIKKLDHKLTVCKVADAGDFDTGKDFYFIGKTDEEISLVCKTDDVPQNTIFAVSTFNTDYILVKTENFEKALKVLSDAGYDVV